MLAKSTLTLAIAAMLLLCAGCSEIGGNHKMAHEIPQLQDGFYDLSIILAGDHLTISVAGDSDSRQEVVVPDDGEIDVIKAGPIQVEGKSRAMVRDEIAKALEASGYFVEPQVVINIGERENPPVISVLGAVNRAGIVRYRKDMTVYMALASAGGMQHADGVAYPVIIVRNSLIQPQIFRFDIEDAVDNTRRVPRLLPGDVVIAQSSLVSDLSQYFRMAHDASVAMINTKSLAD